MMSILLQIAMWSPLTAAAGEEPANVSGLKITTSTQPTGADGWEGWATYDILELQAEAAWSDGQKDPGCSRSGAPPRWKTSYGWFEPPKKGVDRMAMSVADPAERARETSGSMVLWSSELGAEGRGAITVEYGGKTASFAVHARKPTFAGNPKMPPDYFAEFSQPKGWEHVPGMIQYLLAPDKGGREGEVQRLLSATPEEREAFIAEQSRSAQTASDRLEAFIRRWAGGDRKPTELPPDLLPESIGDYKMRWLLCRPQDADPEDRWGIRPTSTIPDDFSALHFQAPDTNCSYLVLMYVAPFGSKMVISGQYPRCRFFSIQVSPPYDPNFPMYGGLGNGEVPIVDADIEPDAGSTNPFRVGADRNGQQREYHVYFQMAKGNAVALNETLNPGSMTEVGAPAFRTPRSTNNTRIGGPFRASGIFAKGALMPGLIWMRYFAPDRATGPLAGVPVPKVRFELADGTEFDLLPRGFKLFARRNNIPVPAYPTGDDKPGGAFGSGRGFTKQFGIHLAVLSGIAQSLTSWNEGGAYQEFLKTRIRELGRALENRGADAPPPGNLEASATCSNYTNYTLRGTVCGEGHVVVLTGKLPKAPKTRGGEPLMTGGEIRYFSITHYLQYHGDFWSPLYPLTCYGTLMDDEIMVPEAGRNEGWYAIVYSRKKDRPRNATAVNGVTWQDWGPSSRQSFTVRWISVMPEWHAPAWAPDGNNMPWAKADWVQPAGRFDPNLLSRNSRECFMKEHHILLHYMTKEQFEALGDHPDPREMPFATGW